MAVVKRGLILLPIVQVVLQCVVNLTFLFGEFGVTALTLTRGGDEPADEYIEVLEGEKLTMECNVSHYSGNMGKLMTVWWGHVRQLTTVAITWNDEKMTDDPRVSIQGVHLAGNDYYSYNLEIANITISDGWKYVCYAEWNDNFPNRQGYVIVLVKHFPVADPVCSTNGTQTSVIDGTSFSCDTVQAYPRVTLTWTIEETGEELNGTYYSYTDEMGQGHAGSELEIRPRLQGLTLACTVTSASFPGLNRTCLVGPIAGLFTTAESPGGLADTDDTTMSAGPGARTGQTGAIGSSTVAAAVVPAVVIPTLFISFLVSLVVLCIVKQKRQDRDARDWKSHPKTDPSVNPTKEGRHGGVILPYSVTTLQRDDPRGETANPRSAHGARDIGGEKPRRSLYEVELDLNGRFAIYQKTPESDKAGEGGGQNTEVPYYMALAEDDGSVPHRLAKGGAHYEHVNAGASGDSEPVAHAEIPAPKTGHNFDVPHYPVPAEDDHTVSTSSPQGNNVHYEHIDGGNCVTSATSNIGLPVSNHPTRTGKPIAGKLKPAYQTRLPTDKCGEGMIDNPFYQPYDGNSPMTGTGSPVNNTGNTSKLHTPENHAYVEIN